MAGTCISWTIFSFSIVTFALAVTSVAHCSFLKLGDSSISYSDYIGFGLYNFEFEGACESYPDFFKEEFEWSEKLPRAMGVIAAVLTGIGMLVVAALQLVLNMERVNNILWKAVRITYSSAVVAQVLTFTFFANETCQDTFDTDSELICAAGPAGIVSFANCIFLLALSIMTCCSPPLTGVITSATGTPAYEDKFTEDRYPQEMEEARSDNFHAPQPRSGGDAAVETEVIISPDGTRKTTKKVMNPDGSVTVTTTIENNL